MVEYFIEISLIPYAIEWMQIECQKNSFYVKIE